MTVFDCTGLLATILSVSESVTKDSAKDARSKFKTLNFDLAH